MEDKDIAHIKLARDRLTWEHIAFAFALSGPYGAAPKPEASQLNAKSTLSILRSLLTTWVLTADPGSLKILVRTNQSCVDHLLTTVGDDPAVKGAWRTLPSTETNIDGLNVKTSSRIASEMFFGIEGGLSHLLSSRTPLHINQGTSEIYASSAHKVSRSMLAGHPKQRDFKSWLQESTDTTRSASSFNSSISFGILDFLKNGSEWAFWFDWYSHILKGNPFSLELQLRIAKISDADWQLGPNHIASRIEEIRARFELEQQVTKLKEQIEDSALSAAQSVRLHNQPPEPVEDAVEFKREIILLKARLDELEQETVKEEPSSSRLTELANWFSDQLTRLCEFGLDISSTFLKEGAKKAGAMGGTALVAHLSSPEGLPALIQSILKYASTLPPG
ncbi:hypothetical protein [Cognatishimia activa]|uniref:hypothetical protein n=1 Tax=Cognatishimia activa TaxID=1715691 RepID=UPI00222EF5CC|nr:hypothetical protein [Cognatishimia activa]UZD91568.1 hypothetical protein M0D42_02845 [Cognatishimia activa]